MRTSIVASLFLAGIAAGCSGEKQDTPASPGVMAAAPSSEPAAAMPTSSDLTERRLQILEHRINTINPEQSDLRDLLRRLKDLEDQQQQLSSDMRKLEQESMGSTQTGADFAAKLAALQETVDRQNREMAELRLKLENTATQPAAAHAGTTQPATHEPAVTPPDVTPAIDTGDLDLSLETDRLTFISRQIIAMGQEGANLPVIIREIRRFDVEAVPVLITALNDRSNRNKLNGCKTALAEIGGQNVVQALIRELDNKITQKDVVEILGQIGDKSAVPPLVDLMRSVENQYFKLEIAGALLRMNNREGVATVIEFLKSSDVNKRFRAITFLSESFGTDRGFKAYDEDAKRQPAYEAWKAWMDETYPE